MSSNQYRIFVCTKHRSPDDADGPGCGSCGSAAIYSAFEQAIDHHGLSDRVQLRAAGCLDHCTAGPVAMVFQPTQRTQLFDWPFLPKALRHKLQTKIQKKLARDRTYYGALAATDAEAIITQHCIQGKVIQTKTIAP
jgi:(2Fe-2S) ferredoxin